MLLAGFFVRFFLNAACCRISSDSVLGGAVTSCSGCLSLMSSGSLMSAVRMETCTPTDPDLRWATAWARLTWDSEISPDFLRWPARKRHRLDLELGTPRPEMTTSAP